MVEIDNHIELNNFNVLSFVDNERILVSQYNSVFIYHLVSRSFSMRFDLPCKKLHWLLLRSKLLSRIFRLEITLSEFFFEDNFLVCFEKYIYCLNICSGLITRVFESKNGKRPLSITVIQETTNFKPGAYFGEYFANPKKDEVRIFRLGFSFELEVVHTFASHTIEHIHAVVYDKLRSCFWILTGDFLKSAAIWQVSSYFKEILMVVGGDQKFRACKAFPIEEGLLYATDSQYEFNSIILLHFNNREWVEKEIARVNGPIIYGGKYKDLFLFSTSVEGVSSDKTFWTKYFDRTIGPGIIEDFSHIILGNLSQGFETIFKSQKDMLPFILFQFGVFTFPTGENHTNYIFASPKALKCKYKTLMLKFNYERL